MPITPRQQRYMKERLQVILSTKPRRWDKSILPEPASVKKARLALESATAIIDAHDEKVKGFTESRFKAIQKMHSDCERAIYFGDPDAALKLLDHFEAKEF